MRFALAGVLVLLTLLVVLWTQQRRLIYFPFGHVSDPGAAGLAGAVPVAFPTSDGITLHGWFVTRTDTPRFTVIVFNGNAGNRAFRAPLARALASRDMAVLLFDYRGFGGQPGTPTEDGLKKDARAARAYAIGRRDVDSARLVYFGESLGSAVAAELATEFAPAALVLRSPFTSLTDVGRHHYAFLPVRWLLRDRYPTLDRVAEARAPLLVIAGDDDSIVPLDQSRRVYEAARDPKSLLIIRRADHNDDALLAGREMIDGIVSFLGSL